MKPFPGLTIIAAVIALAFATNPLLILACGGDIGIFFVWRSMVRRSNRLSWERHVAGAAAKALVAKADQSLAPRSPVPRSGENFS